MQFIALQDPADNWMVYDLASGLPAELAGKLLFGLTRDEAKHLTDQANGIRIACSAGSSQSRANAFTHGSGLGIRTQPSSRTQWP